MSKHYDLMVIGGGPGGYVAAIRAAQLGFATALVEKDALGGTCLNWGCIPTKALLKGADLAHQLRNLEAFGFSAGDLQFDLATLVQHSRDTSDKLSKGIAYLMQKHNIAVIRGEARLTGKCQLKVTAAGRDEDYRADHIILATGARAKALPLLPQDGRLIIGAREAMTPQCLPRRLLVVDSGAIGIEFASLYADLGSEVTVVEVLDRILPNEDAEISARVEKAFSRRGIRVHTATQLKDVAAGEEEVEVSFAGQSQRFDRVIVAGGVTGNIEHLGLESLGVNTERGFVATDAFSRTNVVGLYAIGDVAGAPCLAHKASHEAVICVERIAGVEGSAPLKAATIPGCTYSRPQVASVGLSEDAAKAAGRKVKVGRFEFQTNGKALVQGESAGLVKTVFDAATGELLGAHMVGAEVTEMIQGFALAIGLEATERELMHAVFPHPTLSEAMHEAVLDADGRALHH